MKKNNVITRKARRFTAVLAAALMTASAAAMTVSADNTYNVENINGAIELRNVEGAPGGTAVVQVVPVSGNTCTCYDLLLEFNPRLELEIDGVAGANSCEIFERDGKKYVALVGFTAGFYEDGEPMATLNFHLPSDAAANDGFNVKMAEVKTFASQEADIEIAPPEEAEVSTVTSDCANGLKTFQEHTKSGMLKSSSVGLRGDVNLDGKTNVRDAAAIARYLAKGERPEDIDEKGRFLGDVDDNGQLNIRDAAKIAKYVANGSVSWDK